MDARFLLKIHHWRIPQEFDQPVGQDVAEISNLKS
jgi:hypothetical protein